MRGALDLLHECNRSRAESSCAATTLVSMIPSDPVPTPMFPSRHSATTYTEVGVAIGELIDEIGPDRDASRWSPFVAATLPQSNLVAVVAPRRPSGTLRLVGALTHSASGTHLVIEGTGGIRGHGLRLSHEVGLTKAGSFLTDVRCTTTLGGPLAILVSRRRLDAWHQLAIETITTRVRRTHPHVGATRESTALPRFQHDHPREHALAFSSTHERNRI
jgi:hypothetical protein